MSILENIRKGGEEIWHSIAEGWRQLIDRSGQALTRFVPSRKSDESGDQVALEPSWGLMAGEVAETEDAIVVNVEAPGMRKEDFEISVVGEHVVIRGEKRFERAERQARYHVFEASYGAFERVLPLPTSVAAEGAEASYNNGVLNVRLPKKTPTRRIAINVS